MALRHPFPGGAQADAKGDLAQHSERSVGRGVGRLLPPDFPNEPPSAALYALGEDLHVAVWPGSRRNTADITRFIAQEARSYVLSASGLMRPADFPPETPHLELLLANSSGFLADGGSCIAGPDGEWVVGPFVGEERLLIADLDHRQVLRA